MPAAWRPPALTTMGDGTLQLLAANSFSGPTTITAGGIQLDNPNALQNSTATVAVNNGLTFGDGITDPIIGGLAGSGNEVLETSDSTPQPVALTVGRDGQDTTYSGALSDAGLGGRLAKAGSGMLVVSGNNSYSNGTIIASGRCKLATRRPWATAL